MDKKYIALQCIECGYINVYRLKHSDGKRCLSCDGLIIPIGMAKFESEVKAKLKTKSKKNFSKGKIEEIFTKKLKEIKKIELGSPPIECL